MHILQSLLRFGINIRQIYMHLTSPQQHTSICYIDKHISARGRYNRLTFFVFCSSFYYVYAHSTFSISRSFSKQKFIPYRLISLYVHIFVCELTACLFSFFMLIKATFSYAQRRPSFDRVKVYMKMENSMRNQAYAHTERFEQLANVFYVCIK